MTRPATAWILLSLLAGCAQVVADDAPFDTSASEHSGGGVDDLPADGDAGEYDWQLPNWAPRPAVPADNPMTAAKVELGRHLFHDRRLSGNGTQSCADCHDRAKGFSDPRPVSIGSTGQRTPRNSMGLQNVAYMTSLNWGNPTTRTLEQQVVIPLFGEFPVELGMTGKEDVVLGRLADDPLYDGLFDDAFPGADERFTVEHVVASLASFVRSMVSFDTPVDRSAYGGTETLDADVQLGMDLFFSERLECHHCHGSWNFSLTTTHAGDVAPTLGFQNNGLYDVDGIGGYPADNTGLYEFTEEVGDMGRFRPPTLRNVALTAPYMHDGSVATLEDVIDIYARGGRLIEDGPYAGDGALNPHKSSFVHGFEITDDEKRALLAFLEALTDDTLATDPRFADPFAE